MSETQGLLDKPASAPVAPPPQYVPQQPTAGYQQPTAGYQQPAAGYQQPAAGYQEQPPPQYQAPPGGGQTTVVITNAPTVYGDTPVNTRCTNCQRDIVTTVRYENGLLTWLLVFFLFFFGFWCCCCIPCCIDATKDTVHTCPNCRQTLGVQKRIG